MKTSAIAALVLAGLSASAAPTIVSPADYATVTTVSDKIVGDMASTSSDYFKDTTYLSTTCYVKEDTDLTGYVTDSDGNLRESSASNANYVNVHYRSDGVTIRKVVITTPYRQRGSWEAHTNSLPVRLVWTGTSGNCAVSVWRSRDLASNPSAQPVFTTSSATMYAIFFDPEVGHNYTWTVTDGSGTATGHFYTAQRAPRIIYSDQDPSASGAECSVGRDLGGWTTVDGKVVRQGLIYRSAALEYCNPNAESSSAQEMSYLKNALGIRADIDLREKSASKIYKAGIWAWDPQNQLDVFKWSNIGAGIPRIVIHDVCGVKFPDYTGFTSSKSNKKAVWCAFTNLCCAAERPAIFHCAHGKDRTGSLAYVILGVLGVSETDARRDFGMSWYQEAKEDVCMSNSGDGFKGLTNLKNVLPNSGSDFKTRCYNYLVNCGTNTLGVSKLSQVKSMIDNFRLMMLEEPETAATANPNPDEPEPDVFEYTNYYWRRSAGGGSWDSSTGYWYKDSTGSTKYPGGTDPNSYVNCYYFWPTASLPYARPVCGYKRTGKIVTVCAEAAPDKPVGPENFKAYFSTEGHTSPDRTIIEHRSGVGDYENVDLYFTTYDESKLGENGLSLAYVYSGTAALEVWANATLQVRDIRDMSQKHKSSVKYKAYVKFPAGNCANARFEALDTEYGDVNMLGWFTGGQAGTTQHLKVGNTLLQFNAPGMTNGVAGALVLEFELGSANTTSSAAMLQVAGTLKVNAGSSIVVDAGGKGAGTYKLVKSGTLTDTANLTAGATISNCASGCYGTVVRSGENLNLVIAQGTPPAGDIAVSASASYVTYPSPKFVVTGTVAMGEGTTTATLHYALNGGTEQTQTLTLVSGGSFSAEVPYTAAVASLVWHVTAENVNGGVMTTGSTASATTSRAADSTATTYVWTGAGGDGKWTNILNWTSSSTSAYGYPASGTHATAEFPASLTSAFTCTLDQDVTVKSLYANSPNLKLVLNRKLTVNGTSGSYTSYRFGDVVDGNPSIELVGADAAIVSAASTVRANFGYVNDEGGATGLCTVKYVVPASGWTSTAPVRAAGSDSKVLFYHNAKLVVDATALGVPAEGVTRSVCLASGTDAPGVYQLGTTEVMCAPGAQGSLSVSNNKLVLAVTATGAPPVPPTPVVPDIAVATNALSTASWGYTVTHLGEYHNETVVVVTNGTATWTAPAALENVRFLVVGGGGGGGGDVNAGDGYQGGAGGGGGGVVTGVVYGIAQDASVIMAVGAGGAGGTAGTAVSSKYGAGKAGSASSLKVGGVTYVTANGGGQDQGSTGKFFSGGQAGGTGGSSAGSRPNVTSRGGATKGAIGSAATSLLSAELFGTQGGASSYSYSAGGGGGATEEGGMPPDDCYGGDGGEGLASDITGEVAVYGSGGGGGNCRSSQPYRGGVGGTNAGDGNPVAGDNGENAVANRGGGGGGGGGMANGGAGGSGIVVLRYVATSGVIVEAEVSALVQNPEYTGDAVSCGLAETAGYTVGGATATEVGDYTATITPKAGYVWDDGTTAAKTFAWSVTESEPQLIEVAVPTAVTGLMYTGEELVGVPEDTGYTVSDGMSASAGDHTATATLVTGYCWIGGSTDPVQIPWSIAKTQNIWTTEPSISKATWTTDETPGELTPAATFLGTPEASIVKDNGQSEYFDGTMPTEVGTYVVTYTSGDEENWWGPLVGAVSVSFTITAPVAPVPQPIVVTLFDEHPEWGYKVEGLGVAHDETALVFTNQNASSMAWTVPADLDDVQFLVVGGGGGGGADYNPSSGSAPFLGGGGGGGGGVVTGVVSTVVADTEFSIKVGAGGAGGICNKTQVNGGFGASYAGSDSTVSLGGVAVLTAFGGGNDKGTTSSSAKSGRVGGTGGSNAGSRGGYGTAQGTPTRGSVAVSFASQLAGYGVLGNVGGSGNTGEQYWGYYSASGGGGGATTAGGTPTDYSTGGTGGEGLASDITGTLRVYGSGGGGGTISGNLGGAGGTGAGSGNIDTGNGGSGQDALANQGGGGGGGGRSGNGGKGGSGIVVLRFRIPSAAPAMPSVAGEDVAPAEIFSKAREAKSIVYPSEPTVTGDVGAQVISFGGVDVNVPDYYTATLSGTTVTLALNDNAKPVITDEDETPGIAIVDGKVRLHLGNVRSALYYTILSATSLDSGDWTPCGEAEQGQDDFEFNASGATRFYKASVRDEAE